ncbi:MAG: CDP-diacylglycerol--glycerol-3-phosphate 3-phosphatidyltransferase [Deltaproteobacteria bacterium]|nr:CDP-diacylglycerol--glycerol-3-phosphate 3-phosphatidyltransferase [Deltaproteobacteria bacterium]MBW2265894.1 CDP-diacylglycerol--glycerol-3-phosphate 3-phosphatidyltransferase [Deltaproteobacteria bacterium]MBW2317933.1 CDP-diacylglycerol--glycerol-3-phosphate 3-phosphatidyltransferase [Deltaproteobacteria bacterium]MBW2600744.1 CDP-diacylglycerol--glycerol-3-phosphate 3-phosphatidyltransferase [Deltaproteobacteria bacterium]OEU45100.1 MAG: CDP-diacylglycerol--glycerol-3-phosphate 3-phosph
MKTIKRLLEKFFSSPNNLTLFRVASIPVLILLLLFSNKVCAFMAAIVFSAASITDMLDGLLARRHGLESTLGKFLDPLADKLLISSALIMLIPHGRVPAWMAFVIIGREIAVTGLRAILSEKGVVMEAEQLGKYKTGFQIAAIIPLLFHYSYFNIDFHAVGVLFLWMAMFLTVWSGVKYFINSQEIIRQ